MGKKMAKGPAYQGYKTDSYKKRYDRRDRGSSNGFVLIVVLWTVAITSLVAVSVSEITAHSLKRQMLDIERSRYGYAARSACIYTLMELSSSSLETYEGQSPENSQQNEEDLLTKEQTPSGLPSAITEEELIQDTKNAPKKATKSKDGSKDADSFTIPYVHTMEVGNVTCTTRIEDEAGKFNINNVNEERKEYFHKFLLAAGVSLDEADIITASVLDWLDGDDRSRPDGAEKKYYQSLSRPYLAGNGLFKAVEELTLVMGVTPVIYELLRNEVTIYGERVNVNCATRNVLVSLPHMNIARADKFIKIRDKKGPIESSQELKKILFHLGIAGSKQQDFMKNTTLEISKYLSIYSLAYGGKGHFTYRILVKKEVKLPKILAVYPDW